MSRMKKSQPNPAIRVLVIAVVLSTGLAGEYSAFGEEPEPDQQRWGHLTGQFTWDGEPPARKKIKVTKDQDEFGDEIDDDSLVVNPDNGGIRYVVIYLRTPKPPVHPDFAKALEEPVIMKMEGGKFLPHVVGVRLGQKLVPVNRDKVIHNLHLAPPGDSSHSHFLGYPDEYTFKRSQVVPVPATCNIHPWIKAYVLIRDNPYFAISDEDGRFEINNLPAGEWEFQFWHDPKFIDALPQCERGRCKLTIRADEKTDLGTVKLSPKLFEAAK